MSPSATVVALFFYAVVTSQTSAEWQCPELSARPAAECSCDMPHTLRCAGDHTALQIIGRHLREQRARNKNTAISLLDCALKGVSLLSAASFFELAGVGLHGLVVSSGDIRKIAQGAFLNISTTLLALGLPNNKLPSVPTEALTHLPKLDRLDLSNNKIHALEAGAFKGIQNLTYLDLSYNQLTNISSDTFKPLPKLLVLRLRGNLLKVAALSPLKEASLLRELDLSSNALEGPLSQNTVPPLSCLEILLLSDNTFASIRRGALAGLTNLTHLNLNNNQIDVLEDNAFKHLMNLSNLDLSHNEIVAVSGGSLAKLINLKQLDLSHNFLRSLSAEPLKSLNQLSDLLLNDNDISMIDDGALSDHKNLRRFTIEDNPLNCDCLIAGFARWLREAKYLSQLDKSLAVCATPPRLEGALLKQISKNKLCDDDHTIAVNYDYNSVLKAVILDEKGKFDDGISDNDAQFSYVDENKPDGLDDDIYDEELDIPGPNDLPMSDAQVILQNATFDDDDLIYLSWTVQPSTSRRYRCASVIVCINNGPYKHVACHRSPPAHVIVRGFKINPSEKYKFCISLEEMNNRDVPIALVIGCAPPQIVRPRATYAPPKITTSMPIVPRDDNIRVSEVRSNITTDGLLTVSISIMGLNSRPSFSLPRSQRLSSLEPRFSSNSNCYVGLTVSSQGSLIAQKVTRCQNTLEVSMDMFVRGPYEVCASISKFKTEDIHSICVVPQLIDNIDSLEMKSGIKGLNSALVSVSLGLMVLVIGLAWFVRKMLKKPTNFETHRCFRPEPVPEETLRSSYVMLTATSKV